MSLRALVSACALLISVSIGTQAFSKAPEITPGKWFNNPKNLTWNDLKGRLILVEKWATW